MQYTSEIIRFQAGQRSHHPTPEATIEWRPPEGVYHEGETLVVLVDLHPSLPHRGRELRTIAVNAYWNSSGSLVARLRRSLDAVNRYLCQVNTGATAEGRASGNVTCVALCGEDLFLGQVGPAHALVYTPEAAQLDTFPYRPGELLIPLGAALPPRIHIGYTPLLPQTTLLLATSELFAAQSPELWQATLAQPDFDGVLQTVETVMATSQTSGSAVLLRALTEVPVPDMVETPHGWWPFARRQPATIPASSLPEPPVVITSAPALTEPLVPARLVPRPRISTPTTLEPAPEIQPPSAPQSQPEPSPEPVIAPVVTPVAADEPSASESTRPSWRITLPRWQLPKLTLPQLQLRRPERLPWRIGKIPYRQLLQALLPGKMPDGRVAMVLDPPQERSTVMGGVTLGFLLLIFFITLITYFEFGGAERLPQVLGAAHDARAIAYNIQTVDTWREVLMLADRSLGLDPQNEEASRLKAEAQQAIDALQSAALLQVYPIMDLGVAPAPRRLLIAKGWVYLLNTTTDEVLGIPLSDNHLASIADAPISILKRGQTFYGEAVESLVDLAWVQSPIGYPDGAVFIYSDNGALYIYEPVLGPQSMDRQRLPGELVPSAVTFMKVYGERVYLVNRQQNQVLSYWPVNGLYNSPPRPYFAASVGPPLQNVVDFALDGRLYLLLGDATLHVYYEGAEDLSFNVQGLPERDFTPTLLAVERNTETGSIYLGDPQRERIVVLNKRGQFQHQFRLSGQRLEHLEALALSASADSGILYFIANNRLYAAPLPDFAR